MVSELVELDVILAGLSGQLVEEGQGVGGVFQAQVEGSK